MFYRSIIVFFTVIYFLHQNIYAQHVNPIRGEWLITQLDINNHITPFKDSSILIQLVFLDNDSGALMIQKNTVLLPPYNFTYNLDYIEHAIIFNFDTKNKLLFHILPILNNNKLGFLKDVISLQLGQLSEKKIILTYQEDRYNSQENKKPSVLYHIIIKKH